MVSSTMRWAISKKPAPNSQFVISLSCISRFSQFSTADSGHS
jgi:hypothetical protein